MNEPEDSGIVRVSLRVPRELHARLRELARRDRRSLHAEILRLVELGIAAREAGHG